MSAKCLLEENRQVSVGSSELIYAEHIEQCGVDHLHAASVVEHGHAFAQAGEYVIGLGWVSAQFY